LTMSAYRNLIEEKYSPICQCSRLKTRREYPANR
jgi:hypothetical protein